MQYPSSSVRIGLSWHGGKAEYDAYESALKRRAEALGKAVSIVWLAGANWLASGGADDLHAVCFTGGADVEPARYGRPDAASLCRTDPARDASEWALLQRLQRNLVPVLAICRGAQLLNVFHGGTLIPDLGARNATHRGPPKKEHQVVVEPGTRLAHIAGAGSLPVNSSHHQAVDTLAPGFRISARAGDGTIEAFEKDSEGGFVMAVQWHPESMPEGLVLSDSVLDALIFEAFQHHKQTVGPLEAH